MLETVAPRSYNESVKGSSLSGLWVILVEEEGAKTPMLARAGNGLYLLAFRTGFTARKFVTDRGLENAEPRMVVNANLAEVVESLTRRGANGVLIDYDATNNTYKEAGLVY
jgi:hypothetical protein